MIIIIIGDLFAMNLMEEGLLWDILNKGWYKNIYLCLFFHSDKWIDIFAHRLSSLF